jgi:hypothetical protein
MPPAPGPVVSASCRLDGAPTVLLEEGAPTEKGSRLLLAWEVNNDAAFWSDVVPELPSLAGFRGAIAAAGLDADPRALLRRSLAAGAKDDPERRNLELVLEEGERWLGPISCLEALFFSYQAERMDMATSPTEFTVFLLRSADGTRLKIYYYTVNQAGIGNTRALTEAMAGDLAAGWRLWVNLHNHNFFLSKPDVGGWPAPGLSDMRLFLGLRDERGLEAIWVTNGFSTARIPAADFDRFSAASP